MDLMEGKGLMETPRVAVAEVLEHIAFLRAVHVTSAHG